MLTFGKIWSLRWLNLSGIHWINVFNSMRMNFASSVNSVSCQFGIFATFSFSRSFKLARNDFIIIVIITTTKQYKHCFSVYLIYSQLLLWSTNTSALFLYLYELEFYILFVLMLAGELSFHVWDGSSSWGCITRIRWARALLLGNRSVWIQDFVHKIFIRSQLVLVDMPLFCLYASFWVVFLFIHFKLLLGRTEESVRR